LTVIDDRVIWVCAVQLLDQHGDAAGLRAAQHADELLEQGKLEGHLTWLRIMHRIEQLDPTVAPGNLH